MIAISLEDLGINSDPDYEPAYSQWDPENLDEYDFALALLVYGSWRKLREALRPVAEYAYAAEHLESPLWLMMFWAEVEGETEASIEKALTGVRYDGCVHDAFTTHLYDWVGNTEDLNEFLQVARAAAGTDHEWIRYEPLKNSWLDSQEVRAIYDIVKDDRRGPQALAESKAQIPADIVEWLAKRDYTDSYIPYLLVNEHATTEQTLWDLVGKCDAEYILRSPACTDRVRAEISRAQPSGGALTAEQRDRVTKELRKIQSAIRSGRTGAIERRQGGELQLLNAVRGNPEIGLGEAYKVLQKAEDETIRALPPLRLRQALPVTSAHTALSYADDDF